MFMTGKKFVHVSEIDVKTVVTPKIWLRPKRDKFHTLYFTPMKIFVATARTMLSSDVFNTAMILETLSNYIRFQPLINTKSSNLKCNDNSINDIRDFSFTSRIGELSQGLSYIFAQEVLHYPFVVDYHGFLKKHDVNNIPHDETTPDFIISKQFNNSLSLLESKSGWGGNKADKGALGKGLTQCDNGKKIITTNLPQFVVTKAYCSSANIVYASSADESVLNYVDPTYEESNFIPTSDFVRFHYASWFSLIEDYSNVARLYENTALLKENNFERRTYKGEIFYIQRIAINIFPNSSVQFTGYGLPYLRPPYGISYGISKSTWENLSSETPINEIEAYTPVSNDEVELFADGTIIFYD